MRTTFLFAPQVFGPRLGSPIPIRNRFLGQQCAEPSTTGSGGCRDVVPCPKGPAVSNNPDGAAAPGQGRRYTLVDYVTGELIKEDVGDEIWSQYSVTSLPDAWVCEDPRCKPYCGQQTSEPIAQATTYPCPEMTIEQYRAADQAEQAKWTAAGKTIVTGGCAVAVHPDGKKSFEQSCYFPGPNNAAAGTSPEEGLKGTPGAQYGPTTGGEGVKSCNEQWAWMCQNLVKPEDAAYKYCPGQAPAAAPAPQVPTPAPAPAPQPEGPVPLSIDIQVFTPGGIGPIPAQPLMQPVPIAAPAKATPAAQPVVKAVSVPAPKEPEAKALETGSAVGIGLVALLAIAAAAFGGGK